MDGHGKTAVPQGGAYPPGGGYASDSDDDLRGAPEHASRSAGGSADQSLFSTVVGLVAGRKKSLAEEDIDEDGALGPLPRYLTAPLLASVAVARESTDPKLPRFDRDDATNATSRPRSDAVKQHKRYYDEADGDEADDRSLGSAAAMQALKLFSGGQSGSAPEGNSKSAFIGLAMGEASKVHPITIPIPIPIPSPKTKHPTYTTTPRPLASLHIPARKHS